MTRPFRDCIFGRVDQEILRGGVNAVVRRGSLLHRPAGPWSPTVQALLRHLADAGFPGAPRAHGFDDDGHEIVDFVAGDVPGYPMPDYVWSSETLVATARLLRAYHEATAGFAADGPWYQPAREPAEVVCHGDVAPYNTVFRAGHPVALIDFDTAHPGPRVWDIAYAVYRFVPLGGPANHDRRGTVAEQADRVRLFCDAYGLPAADRAQLPAVVEERVRAMAELIRSRAAAGDAAFARHLAEGHADLYDSDAAYVREHAAAFAEGL
ncbi:MAG: aminoglycoside phosphotransferase family protein [Hamadaea sp.]|nr:aminoglycoside phosphotransferase family protein [Hamadaea sp.]NUT05860.1 aminoglycoside phosphotransferase family protein [Hamadaea sp.]